MAKTRAIMTDTERERIARLDDVEEIKRYQAISRVRRRIQEELTFDVELLQEHEPDLYDELAEVVCEEFEAEAKDHDDTSGQQRNEKTTQQPPETNVPEREPPEVADTLRERMEKELDALDVPGRPEAVERTRREAIAYAWDRLREEGEMKPSKLADDTIGAFFDDPDLGYSISQQHPGYQLLDNCLRKVMMELPGVHSTGRTWQFREENGDE